LKNADLPNDVRQNRYARKTNARQREEVLAGDVST
jgi:hypothetical protein